MAKTNGTILYRVCQLEKNYCELDGKIETILTNHLPHIREDLISLKTRITTMTMINVGALILVALLAYILKA